MMLGGHAINAIAPFDLDTIEQSNRDRAVAK